MTLAQEVLAALQEAGREVGNGPLVLTFTRASAQATPWGAAGQGITFQMTAVDMGIKEVYASGSSATRKARILMVDATGVAPQIGDKVDIDQRTADVLAVMPSAPAGVPLYYRVEIST